MTCAPENLAPTPPPIAAGIIADRWPTLAGAMGRYERQTAEDFSRRAYEHVTGGIIRQEDRAQLAAAAENLGIRAFDAQLLIACAVRKWALDHRYDPTPSRHAPALSFEHRSWQRLWARLTLIVGLAIALDTLILLKWLS